LIYFSGDYPGEEYDILAEIPGVARDSRKSERLNPIELLTPPD
jgi:hypothetical protein